MVGLAEGAGVADWARNISKMGPPLVPVRALRLRVLPAATVLIMSVKHTAIRMVRVFSLLFVFVW